MAAQALRDPGGLTGSPVKLPSLNRQATLDRIATGARARGRPAGAPSFSVR